MKLKHMHPKFMKIVLCWNDALPAFAVKPQLALSPCTCQSYVNKVLTIMLRY